MSLAKKWLSKLGKHKTVGKICLRWNPSVGLGRCYWLDFRCIFPFQDLPPSARARSPGVTPPLFLLPLGPEVTEPRPHPPERSPSESPGKAVPTHRGDLRGPTSITTEKTEDGRTAGRAGPQKLEQEFLEHGVCLAVSGVGRRLLHAGDAGALLPGAAGGDLTLGHPSPPPASAHFEETSV